MSKAEAAIFNRCWNDYKLSESYIHSHAALIKWGSQDPYADNILLNAFRAGYFANKPKVIIRCDHTPTEKKRQHK